MVLVEHVHDFLQRHDLARLPGVIAVSGGPDSVALAHACAMLCQRQRLANVAFAHLNHQLRGSDSDADEAFVRNLPTAWHVPLRCCTHRSDVAALARASGDNLENAARQARYGWLIECARQTGASWIATGHTADDQAETVLHHLLRGSGLSGLAGMPERRTLAPNIELIRPLLSLRRTDVMAYLHHENLPYCHDCSNDDPSFTRNRLRHQVMPLLQREFNPALVEVLGRTARQLRDIQLELTCQAEALLAQAERPRAGDIIVLARKPLQDAGATRVRELLRLIWQREGWPTGAMDFDHWDRAAAIACGQPGGQDFPGGVQIRAASQVVQLTAPCTTGC